MKQKVDRLHIAVRVILVQILIAMLAAGIVFVMKGWTAGYSVALGALAGIIPTSASAFMAFTLNNQDANLILGAIYSGAILKYLLTAAIFALIVIYVKPLQPLMVLVGLIATQLAMIFAPIMKR